MSTVERVGTAERERLASDLALRGGRLALEYFHRAQVTARPDGSLAADADLAIQTRLAAEIARAFPDDTILREEDRLSAGPRPGMYHWVLDPVNGAGDFMRGLPGFSVSIGVLRHGQPFAGAVYDPITRWLFTACAGRGAWLNDRPLRTSSTPSAAGPLIAVRTPVQDDLPPFVEEWLRRHDLHGFGSTALQLCYAAMGGLDLVYHPRASLSDLAGAAPVLLEAGGVLSLADGAPLFPAAATRGWRSPIAVLAGNPTSHARALADVAATALSR